MTATRTFQCWWEMLCIRGPIRDSDCMWKWSVGQGRPPVSRAAPWVSALAQLMGTQDRPLSLGPSLLPHQGPCCRHSTGGGQEQVWPKQHLSDADLGGPKREGWGREPTTAAGGAVQGQPEAADSYKGLSGTPTKRKKPSQGDTVQVPTSAGSQARHQAPLQKAGPAPAALGTAAPLPARDVLPGSRSGSTRPG